MGSVVTRVRAEDEEGDKLDYTLEKMAGFNIAVNDPRPLPFTIDNETGVVYTNESLIARVSMPLLTNTQMSKGLKIVFQKITKKFRKY